MINEMVSPMMEIFGSVGVAAVVIIGSKKTTDRKSVV